MSSFNPELSFNNSFGSNGSGDGEFDYPIGILILNDEIFVTDKQNHRVQVFDIDGVFARKFGTVGSGNDEFFFPEGIATDGTDLYIVDSGNHRVKKTDTDGVYISEFGSEGAGDANFKYPNDIVIDNSLIYICDEQNHRIKIHDLTTHAFISEFGTHGTANENLNFPESVHLFNGFIYVADSGNHKVKIFTTSGVYSSHITSKIFDYPVGLVSFGDYITVIDRVGNELSIFNITSNLLTEYGSYGTGEDEFYFPQYAAYYDSKLFITDSGNHRIKILNADFTITKYVYLQTILNLTRQLYPTGRVWWLNYNNIFSNLHEALALSESRALVTGNNLLNSILPDNDNFTEEDAFNWERALGLYQQTSLDLEVRKASILRAMQHPGTIAARQHYLYLQRELRAAGFDVYVQENRFETTPGDYEVLDPESIITQTYQFGVMEFDVWEFGGEITGLSHYYVLANYIDESKDTDFFASQTSPVYPYTTQLRATFFIGGESFPEIVNVDADREKEFRELILKIKPAQTVGFLFINYT